MTREDAPNPGSVDRLAWTLRRAALVGVLGLGAFLLTAGVIRRGLPGPPEWAVTGKLEHLAESGRQYDALFIGSSLFFRNIIPEAVDARLAERGITIRSFNLGAEALRGFELDHVLRQALAHTGPKLRYVWIEPSHWAYRMRGNNRRTQRSRNWHTPRQTLRALTGVAASDEPIVDRIGLLAGHTQVALWRLSSYGEGRRLLDSAMGVPQEQAITAEAIIAQSGYQGLEQLPVESTSERRAELTDDPKGFRQSLLKMGRKNERHNLSDLGPGSLNLEALAAQVELVGAAGAEAIYLVPPGNLATPHAFYLDKEGLLPHFMSFNDQERFPDFYRMGRRFDPGHLNRAGAEQFSRRVADRWADLIESGELR